MPSDAVLATLRLLPPRPGVYLFKDASGRVLYVGKAASVRARVRQYFQDPDTQANPRLRLFVPRIKAEVTKSARPSFSSGSNKAPASKYPLTTTDGLLKFDRVRTVMPLDNTSR